MIQNGSSVETEDSIIMIVIQAVKVWGNDDFFVIGYIKLMSLTDFVPKFSVVSSRSIDIEEASLKLLR